ncbi:MAG TPA: RNA polymerase sigma factor [Baekduia sp.]
MGDRNFAPRRQFQSTAGSHPVATRVEVSALRHSPATGLRGPTPLLRLQGDERLVALTRRGNQAAYEALVARYQARLLAFCRHMLSSREDAEDVLQEVFAAAFNAMLSDERPINVRPWLYRIARNRCLNHLRKQTAIGVDSMDVHLAEHGTTTADKVDDREDFRQLVADVQTLAETQRTALLLREIDALSYEQIAEAMETTVPSVKSLLVRARVSLAEAAEARRLTCDEVREELGEWAEGLTRVSAPVRRHVRTCTRCSAFKKQLKQTNKALAAVFPVGPLLLLKKFLLAQSAGSAAAGAGGAAATGTATVGGATAGSALYAGVGAVATKTAAGLAAVAIVTTGAVEVDHVKHHRVDRPALTAQVVKAPVAAPPVAAVPAPKAVRSTPQRITPLIEHADTPHSAAQGHDAVAKHAPVPSTTAPAATDTGATTAVPGSTTVPATTQEGYDNTVLPDQPGASTATPAVPAVPVPPQATPTPAAPATPAPPATDPGTSQTTPPVVATPVPADPAPPADPTSATPAPPADPAPSTTAPADPVVVTP